MLDPARARSGGTMSGEDRPLILDADGVFLSERPYFNSALGTALAANDLINRVAGRWDLLADLAFGPVGLQRVTKGVGCNSNWDLAAVLVRALEDESWRAVLDEILAAEGCEFEALQALRVSALGLFRPDLDASDPLERFGISRTEPFFEDVIDLFQQVLNDRAGLDWRFETCQLKEPAEKITRALGQLRAAGHVLRVCTGRGREETEIPIRTLGLEGLLSFTEITCADEVARAETVTGMNALGKPHWFAPACATVGFEAALDVLSNDRELVGNGVYAGDAWSDFRAVQACRARGLGLTYVHVRSGVTTREQEQVIGNDAATLAVVSSLSEMVPLLTETPP